MTKRISTSQRVLGALSIFGSVQAISIVCSIVRTKVIAICLGPLGVGIFALYNSALDVVNQLAQLNLRQSSVREIAAAPASKASLLKGVVRRMACLLGLLGGTLMLIFSPLLSWWTFGNSDHTFAFVLLAGVVLFNSMISGEQALLQASGRLKRLALASLWGSIGGTLVSILLIWLFDYNGIVPSIISFSVITAVAFLVMRDKDGIAEAGFAETLKLSKPILKLGGFLTAAILSTMLAQYVFLVWLRMSSPTVVGLYQAGFVLMSQYVGLVFTALAVEFYPRLSRVSGSDYRLSLYVRHELMLLQWGLLGCIVLFLNLVPVIIPLLYSDAFLPVSSYVTLAAVGTSFKASSFVLAFVILARGDGKIYLLTEFTSSALFLVFGILGYNYGELEGLGLAYAAWYLCYLLITLSVYKLRYKLSRLVAPMVMTSLVTIVVAAQACLCYCKLYLAATIVTCVVVPLSVAMLYYLFLKRRTVKE